MESKFWHNRWETNQIGFHLSEVNPLLIKFFNQLALPQNSRIFIPLCGKTKDIAWLMSQGYQVVGAELSEIAIQQLFQDMKITPKIQQIENLKLYSADKIDIWVGDIFNVTAHLLGPVNALFDRAALVALPEDMRERYANHLAVITNQAPQLLITWDYDQNLMSGPPFSVSDEEVKKLYHQHYRLEKLESLHVPNGLKGSVPARENVWNLKKM